MGHLYHGYDHVDRRAARGKVWAKQVLKPRAPWTRFLEIRVVYDGCRTPINHQFWMVDTSHMRTMVLGYGIQHVPLSKITQSCR